MGRLMQLATEHENNSDKKRCKWLYRNKQPHYFQAMSLNGSVESTRLKNWSGDPANCINGQLKGLFYYANVNKSTGKLPTGSPFGECRVKIRMNSVIGVKTSRLYFADFYCTGQHKGRRNHYATLVHTKRGSQADGFCDSKLIELDITDNPFLRYSKGSKNYQVSTKIWVEVFHTEDMDYSQLEDNEWVEQETEVTTTKYSVSDLQKDGYCKTCNIPMDDDVMQLDVSDGDDDDDDDDEDDKDNGGQTDLSDAKGDRKPDLSDANGDRKSQPLDANGKEKPDPSDANGDGKSKPLDANRKEKPDPSDANGDRKSKPLDANGGETPDPSVGNEGEKPDLSDAKGVGRTEPLDANGEEKPDLADAKGDGKPDPSDANGDRKPGPLDANRGEKLDPSDGNGDGKSDSSDDDDDGGQSDSSDSVRDGRSHSSDFPGDITSSDDDGGLARLMQYLASDSDSD